tara:strand:+ start:1466 stop:2623 length:1158 start_codon:yes stop_codon:yes gene_type:complete
MKPEVNYAGSDAHSASAQAAAGTIKIVRPEPIIKADNLAYILFNKVDLKLQKQFLTDFGMVIAEQSSDAIYMRGTGTLPYFYVAYDRQKTNLKKEKKGYMGIGFSVESEAELQKLSKATSTSIEPVDGPGGGKRVRLIDPDGFIVDVVWGRKAVERLPSRTEIPAINTPFEKKRVNQGVRTPLQPSALERLGHCVLSVSNYKKSLDWYMTHVGLIATDVLCLEDGTPTLSFNRLDRGKTPTDHHSFVLLQNLAPQYMHSAYETIDLDSVGQGQQYLTWKGWKHFWGMGRHTLGSQIFDYWLDPEGDELEHYADGDVFDDSYVTRYHLMDIGGTWAWGDDVPKAMRTTSLKQVWLVVKALKSGMLSKQVLVMIKKALSMPARPWLK